IVEFLQQAMAYRERIAAPEAALADGGKQAEVQAGERYYSHIADLEQAAANDLLELYRHRHTRAGSGRFDNDLNLAHEETWRRFGLDRKQLAVAGTLVGAGAGATVDAGTLGG